jgi:restriction endonuclease Mrr
MLKNGHDELRVALVIRKDGREVGRERVAEVRGTLHHYGPAAATWIVTTGQVLSGAREEATLAGAAPVALFDGIGLCKLLEEAQVGVTRSTFSVAIPDLDLLDTLRGV